MTSPKLILCKASAGSGKTFTLAKTYLQIVLNFEHEQFCYYDRILAVTFTNKATEEMKSRILKFLTEISEIQSEEECKKSDIAQALLLEYPHWTFEKLAWKAKVALSKILHDYSQFSIMTIDKFFNRIVKAFLFELKLQNAANVSLDTQKALDEAMEEMLSEYSHDDKHVLSKWLKEIATEKLEDGKNWKPKDIVMKLSQELFKENVAQLDLSYPAEKIESLLEIFKQIEDQFKSAVLGFAQNIMDIIEQHHMQEGYFSRNTFVNQIRKIIADPRIVEFTPSIISVIEDDAYPFLAKIKKDAQADYYLSIWENSILPIAKSLLDFNRNHVVEYNTIKGFKKYIKSLAILSEVSEKMKNYRERNGIMLISDNNSLINKVVGNTEAPFLYEKIGNKYRYILLDEFQDTSTLQWKNFLPLILEVLSHREDGKVLIVGDAKQAIYRWRGGNFQLIQNDVQADLATFWENDRSNLILNKNFRSCGNIVQFNNDVFEKLGIEVQNFITQKYTISEVDNELFHTLPELYAAETSKQISNKESGGFVEVKFIDPVFCGVSKEEYDAETISSEYTISTIRKLVEQYQYDYKDIAILTRKNKESVKASNWLKSENIPVMTSEALLLNSHSAIRLIISALKFLLYPKEDLYLSSVLYEYAQVHQIHKEDLLEKEKRKEYFNKYLHQLSGTESRNILGALSVYEIVRNLIDILKLDTFRDIYTEQFLDMVLQYQEGAHQTSIIDFVEWWEKKNLSITIAGDTNAVKIATIHKSKGLEYKVVILPFFNWDMVVSAFNQPILWPEIINSEEMMGFKTLPINYFDTKDSYYFKDFQNEAILYASDSLNVGYVALTRAEQKMYVLSPLKRTEKDGITQDNIGGLLYHTLENNYPNNFTEDAIYQLGTERIKSLEETKKEEKQEEIKGGLKASRKKKIEPIDKNITINSHSRHKIPLAKASYKNKESIIGEMIHETLSKYRKGEDIDMILANISYSYSLDENIQNEVNLRVKQFFEDAQIQKLYLEEGEIFTEKSLLINGEIYRFDWLILNGQQGKLYDFKTGLESSNKSLNTKNLLSYKSALTSMGYDITETAFIYINQEGLPKFEYIE
ncbi:MAG TPA: UvrD-helicase domain-containing protein [Chitinophagales bacterium]|nr:UvrD-helicase domain-containing protein [Chitinophagales bacterium]